MRQTAGHKAFTTTMYTTAPGEGNCCVDTHPYMGYAYGRAAWFVALMLVILLSQCCQPAAATIVGPRHKHARRLAVHRGRLDDGGPQTTELLHFVYGVPHRWQRCCLLHFMRTQPGAAAAWDVWLGYFAG